MRAPALAATIVDRVARGGGLALADTDTDLLQEAMRVFDLRRSKQNTLFDALVAATARRYQTTVIFSFDHW